MCNSAWYVYIVCCSDGSLYTGIAKNVEKRVFRHNSGTGAKYTRSRRPVELVHVESAGDHSAALRREQEIKSLSADAKRWLIDRAS
jgi:putative endonuclease